MQLLQLKFYLAWYCRDFVYTPFQPKPAATPILAVFLDSFFLLSYVIMRPRENTLQVSHNVEGETSVV